MFPLAVDNINAVEIAAAIHQELQEIAKRTGAVFIGNLTININIAQGGGAKIVVKNEGLT